MRNPFKTLGRCVPKRAFSVALLTGATSGLGLALVALLSKRGIPLMLTGRDAGRLKAVSERYSASYLPLDLSRDRSPLIQWIREHGPDLVINNAGFTLYGPVVMHSTKSQMEILEVNGAAAMEISIEAARALAARKKGGTILNVSSSAGEFPIPSISVYAASKSFLTSFSKSFDAEMRPHGIRVLAAIPGPIATPFAERASGGLFTQRPSWTTLTPQRAAQLIWNQIEREQGVKTIGFWTRVSLILAKLLPRAFLDRILQKNLRKRYHD